MSPLRLFILLFLCFLLGIFLSSCGPSIDSNNPNFAYNETKLLTNENGEKFSVSHYSWSTYRITPPEGYIILIDGIGTYYVLKRSPDGKDTITRMPEYFLLTDEENNRYVFELHLKSWDRGICKPLKPNEKPPPSTTIDPKWK